MNLPVQALPVSRGMFTGYNASGEVAPSGPIANVACSLLSEPAKSICLGLGNILPSPF